MTKTSPAADIEADDVRPYVMQPDETMPDDVVADHYETVDEDAHIDDVLDTIDTLAANGIDDERKLIEFGKRMSSLIYHGGMTPSAAKARATKDVFQRRRSTQDLANLLGVTRGGFNKLSQNAGGDTVDSRRLHYMTFNVPMNLVLDEVLAAEPPADYETRYVVLEVVDPRLEATETQAYTWKGPDTQYVPREPQYALVREEHTRDRGDWSDDDPAERSFGTFCDMSIEWYMDDTELVDALYEGRYFETEDRAETWAMLLNDHGFDTESTPRERLNPEVLAEDEGYGR